jgi:hypothetical protein
MKRCAAVVYIGNYGFAYRCRWDAVEGCDLCKRHQKREADGKPVKRVKS